MKEENSIKLTKEQLEEVVGGSALDKDRGKDYQMVRCPNYGTANEVPAKDGMTVTCSACGTKFQI